ncbi:uncharacterized protein LOC126896812 [Daktulosphaira vitifoliae]|uniref:uncharacterized protein LOC126896812 n=1 Tax=Daktulosphaira vitifoliae TaxID=58002 RepID=UPI0021A98B8A|nr:uncharacterized protein LOC126896812 [Daktulosphaira vitifoliae]
MKRADSYEFIRWKSSRGRLVVQTTWVKGVRHVIFSDEDDQFNKKENRHLYRSVKTKRTSSVANTNENDHEYENNDSSSNYVNRILQWLQTPRMIDSCQKPMTASNTSKRHPALIKTCSIPENKVDDHQVVKVKKKARNLNRNFPKHFKTELHVHMPSISTSNDNSKVKHLS